MRFFTPPEQLITAPDLNRTHWQRRFFQLPPRWDGNKVETVKTRRNLIQICLLCAAALCGSNSGFALNWTQTSAPTNDWACVALSADGTKMAAVGLYDASGNNPGSIYISTNSGAAWTQSSAPSNFWEAIASSADGNKLVAVGTDLSEGLIYTSTNSGITWKQVNGLPTNYLYWFSAASSADGTKLSAIGGDHSVTNFIFASTNSGTTWTQTSAPCTNWTSIASSADGTKLVAVVNAVDFSSGNGGPIFTSTNSGTTWTQAGTISNAVGWQAVASSADGTKLAAVDFNHIFVSTDSGMTWRQTSAPQEVWSSVASSTDGNKVIAATTAFQNPLFIYTSTDSGATWISNNVPDQNGHVVACSADGNELIAASRVGIYTARITPTPQLNLSLSAGDLTICWLVPSTNFVMQQSSDLQNWADMTNASVLNLTNLQNEVTIPLPSSNVFYRLKTP